jgi:hypothetical protein
MSIEAAPTRQALSRKRKIPEYKREDYDGSDEIDEVEA